MKTVDYAEWKLEIAARQRRILSAEGKFRGHAAGRRPRDPEKEKLLARLDKARFERHLKSGKIEIIGPRHWKWRIDFRTP